MFERKFNDAELEQFMMRQAELFRCGRGDWQESGNAFHLAKELIEARAEIERQRALIKDAEYIFSLQLWYFNNENENYKDREYIDYLLGLGRYFNSNE